MERILSIAEKIQTPLSLSAFIIIILFLLYRQLFDKLPIENVVSSDTYKIIVKAMTFVFILAVVGLVLGLLSYALTTIIDYKHQQQAELYLEQVRSKDPVKRNVALANLNEILLSQPTIAKRACLVLSSFVRSGLPNNIDDEHGRLSEDIEQSMHVLSNLLKSDSCLEIDLTGSDLRRLSLPDGNLERVNLTNAHLEESNLAGANLQKSVLIGAFLNEANLRKTNLTEANLQAAKWGSADVSEADLTRAVGVAGSDLRFIIANDVKLDFVDLRRIRAPVAGLPGVSVTGANLKDVNLLEIRHLCWNAVKSAITDNLGRKSDYEC